MTAQEAWPPETQHGPCGDGGAQAEGVVRGSPARKSGGGVHSDPESGTPGVRREAIPRGVAQLWRLVRGRGWGQKPAHRAGCPVPHRARSFFPLL